MNPSDEKSGLKYQQAGVDIAEGNRLVEMIKPITRATQRPEVLSNIGGFGGLFALDQRKYQQPVLVSATDGVGTKLKLAQILGKHGTIGIDLVAMCVNDIIVSGAEPLFFLDYFASGKLHPEQAVEVIRGIGEGCQQAGCALIGGETAEMPGMYQGDDYDLAGFCVGMVDKNQIVDGSKIEPGHKLIGLASSGPHSNGFSLIRKIIESNEIDLSTTIDHGTSDEATLGHLLLTPTKIYVEPLLHLLRNTGASIHGMAHITGGGILENLPRMLPQGCAATIHSQSWQWPEIFSWLQQQGGIATEEMYRTFNCGVGMILATPESSTREVIQYFQSIGQQSWQIGSVVKQQANKPAVNLC